MSSPSSLQSRRAVVPRAFSPDWLNRYHRKATSVFDWQVLNVMSRGRPGALIYLPIPDQAVDYQVNRRGLLGSNYFRLGDLQRAREHTERALEECEKNGDDDGVRIYRDNLRVITAQAPNE